MATITPTVDAPQDSETGLVYAVVPGSGYATATLSDDRSEIIVQAYDSDGRAMGQPIVAASDLPEGAVLRSLGASADGSRLAVVWTDSEGYFAQVIGTNGQPIGEPVDLETVTGTGLYSSTVAATSDGGFAIVGSQSTGAHDGGVIFLNRLSSNGEASEPVNLGVNLNHVGGGGELKLVAANGELLVITARTAEPGTVLRRLSEDGDPLAEPVTLRPPESHLGFRDVQLLANGDILVSWTESDGSPYLPQPIATHFQRIDSEGNSIGDAAVTDPARSFAPLQDGGFVVSIDGELQVFDRNNEPVGEPVGPAGGELAALAMDDGHVLVVGRDAGEYETSIFDDPASRTAEWGGNSTYIATWQEQELLSREDGIDFLRSDAGVAMKPWIVNFEAASDADGINATANDMANHLLGGNGANVFIAGAGNDKLYGLGGNDWLLGEDGNDLLDGGDGHDVLIGGLGNDSIAAGAGADTVAGDQGDDAVSGGGGHDIVQGGAGRDFVNGDAGNDTLSGGAGRDWLHGGSGDDLISGDRGADTLEGGSGADQFRFGANSGHDIILDFEYGTAGDRLVIDVAGNGTLNGLDIPDAASLFDAAEDTDDGVLIGLGDGHSILLAGLVKADLGADMFLLV